MKYFVILCLLILSPCLPAQQSIDVASPKPTITINSALCHIGNTIYSCMPKTCTGVMIDAGDSITFCTDIQIFLSTDTAYYMRWDFNGSSNYPASVYDYYPTATPLCYQPVWTVPGTYTVDVYYNGWLSAYPGSDCYTYGPSHWIIQVDVLPTSSVGTETAPATMDCSVSPNPGTGLYSVKTTNDKAVRGGFVSDVAGRRIKIIELNNLEQLDLSSESQGIYFLQLETDLGPLVRKIVRE